MQVVCENTMLESFFTVTIIGFMAKKDSREVDLRATNITEFD
ncbi:hypothetical protein FHS14_001591 [Paenibacillus baekrokdamisoli]|nr:hypothetical protein [Paenibacillus baekrokdamisoli]MBB3068604.1 hypothetical protein [Paenibacillus baekrokdamisoli]